MPERVEIEITITQEDLVEQVVLLTERSPSVRSRRLFRKSLILALLALYGGVLALEFGAWWVVVPVVVVALGYALLYDRIVVFWTRRHARRFIAESPGIHPTGTRRLVLEGNSVRIETPNSTSTVRLEGPVRVEEVRGFAHVELGAGEALFVPLRPADRGDPRAFVDALRARGGASAAG